MPYWFCAINLTNRHRYIKNQSDFKDFVMPWILVCRIKWSFTPAFFPRIQYVSNLTFLPVLHCCIRPLFSHRRIKIRRHWCLSIMINLAGHQMNSVRLWTAWNRGLRNPDTTSCHVLSTKKYEGIIFANAPDRWWYICRSGKIRPRNRQIKCAGNNIKPRSSAAHQVSACVCLSTVSKMADLPGLIWR